MVKSLTRTKVFDTLQKRFEIFICPKLAKSLMELLDKLSSKQSIYA